MISVIVVLLVVGIVIWLVVAPLRREPAAPPASERAELEALKAAKYREIRDAELDYRTGKLSEADWRALDRALRAEAVELLDRIDALD